MFHIFFMFSSVTLFMRLSTNYQYNVDEMIQILETLDDKDIVTLASNIFGYQPITKVVIVPSVNKKRQRAKFGWLYEMSNYNKFMGKVNHFDQNIDNERVSSRRRKWWHPLFAFGIDAACQN